jgi:spoIIIJ-associated protein
VSQTDEAAVTPVTEPAEAQGGETPTDGQPETDQPVGAHQSQVQQPPDQQAPDQQAPDQKHRTPTAAVPGSDRYKELEHEGDIAADFLEELLDIADLDGDIDLDVEGDRAMVAIVGDDLDSLVGPNGKVLDALQDLTRLAVHQQSGERSRLILDVAEYRANRRKELALLAVEAARTVRETGTAVSMKPMSAFERKVVHDAVAAEGLTSESEGVEPQRFVVVHPAG